MPKRGLLPDRTKPSKSSSYGGMQEREIQTRLEIILDSLSTRQPLVLELARRLAQVSLAEQQRVLAGIETLAALETHIAEMFCAAALDAFADLDDTDWARWLQDIAEAYLDHLASQSETVFQLPPHELANTALARVNFEDVVGAIGYFLIGLAGREFTIKIYDSPGPKPTNGTTIYLPKFLADLYAKAGNLRLYKAIAVHQWAQLRNVGPPRQPCARTLSGRAARS